VQFTVGRAILPAAGFQPALSASEARHVSCARLRDILETGPTVPRKKPKFDMKKEVRKLARERVGTVPSSKPILPKSERRKPKHKKPISGADEEST
jgi:hypothetical protein